MIFAKKRFLIRLFVIAFITLSIPATVLGANRLSIEVKPVLTLVSGGPAIVKPANGTYSFAGTIKNISSSSITLYNGATCIITGSTICKAPMSGGSMMNMQTISCSSFTKGETVQISAVKNTSGELVATEIHEALF